MIILSFAVFTLPVRAQECVFSNADATPDTLDAPSYYPLAVGNIWETEFYRSDRLVALERREIVGYAFFKDIFYYRLDTREYAVDENLEISFEGLETDYQYATDSSIVRNGGLNPVFLDLRFNSDIQSCYRGKISDDDSTLITVDSLSPPTLFLEEGGEPIAYDVTSIKRYSWPDSTMEFGFGIGLIATTGADSLMSRLTSAIVDGNVYGTSLAEKYSLPVGLNERFVDMSDDIEIFPLPATDELVVLVPDFNLGQAVISIFDAVGRLVLSVERTMYRNAEVRLSVNSIPPGTYFVRLQNGNTVRSRQFIVVH